jgi:hypothetical protein
MCCQLLGLRGRIGFVMVNVRDGLDGVVNVQTAWGVIGFGEMDWFCYGECERWTGRCCERTDCLRRYWVWGDGLVLLW